MAQQLTFDLPSVPALGREDFFISPANALAVAALDNWRAWPMRKLALSGPSGAGKTHMAHVFAAATGAPILHARDVIGADLPALAPGPLVVEDIPTIAGQPDAERALFHLHNLSQAEGGTLLFTAVSPPTRWPLTLPDLASRMQACDVAQIEPPDDNLLAAVIAKMFADRQLNVDADVITYLTLRMDRSFAAARDVVTRLDAMSLTEKRPITKHLAARALDKGPLSGA
ncbi:HdaA/DnaA family protein [Oceaniglobus ichthyenteri]|uniref:HdaA/DnaA family protein n=1 Tax=Oceaniglobus ichthyenteri TaxID=2136177 RepID=UPI000D3B2A7A|nr:DnaA/Hda family protein [Oceaniglobus ichthyenteri]